jgi:hypothetical protein
MPALESAKEMINRRRHTQAPSRPHTTSALGVKREREGQPSQRSLQSEQNLTFFDRLPFFDVDAAHTTRLR